MTGIASPHLTDMEKSRRRCTPEYDLRLSRYLGTSPGFWLRLQLDYELMRAEREKGERTSREARIPQFAEWKFFLYAMRV